MACLSSENLGKVGQNRGQNPAVQKADLGFSALPFYVPVTWQCLNLHGGF